MLHVKKLTAQSGQGCQRIGGGVAITDFKVEMRASRITATADATNDLPRRNHLTTTDIIVVQMAVKGEERAMHQHHQITKTPTVPTGKNDRAAVGRADSRTYRSRQINAGMERVKTAHKG